MIKSKLLVLFLCLSSIAFSQIKVGEAVPDFKLTLTDGTRFTSEQATDKVIVFKFWFTTCEPCIKDIPKANALVAQYKDNKDVLFLAPALDNSDAVKSLLKRFKFDFQTSYAAYETALALNPKGGYPTYIIVDKNGIVRYNDSESKGLTFDDLKLTLATVVAQK